MAAMETSCLPPESMNTQDSECIMAKEQSLDFTVDGNLNSESPEVIDDAVIDNCLNYLKQYELDKKEDFLLKPPGSSSWSEVPEFLKHRIKSESHKVENSEDIPPDSDLHVFYNLMNKSHKSVDYQAFSELYHQFPKKIQAFFEPDELFSNLFLEADRFGRISTEKIMELYTDKFATIGYYAGLDRFSITKEGYLTYTELIVYFNHFLPVFENDTRRVRGVCIDIFSEMIVFKFGQTLADDVLIADLIASDIFKQILAEGEYARKDDFFTITHVNDVLDQYLELSHGQGIMREVIHQVYPTVPYSFWRRYFHVYCANGFMYMSEFYKFLYSRAKTGEICVIRFLFKVFDIDGDGYISMLDMEYFYTELAAELQKILGDYIPLVDLYDGLYDMCGSKSSRGISREDIIKSGMAKTFFSILMDAEEWKNFELQGSLGPDPNDLEE